LRRCSNNKGEDSPNYGKSLVNDLKNGRKNPNIPSNKNNLEYRDLKNFNWIKEKLQNDRIPIQKLERPLTRGGEQRGLDFSFIEKSTNQDFNADGSYFDRPITRSKPRRPVSRQVRLNKRVNNLRGTRADSESFRGSGELGDCDPPSLKDNMNVHLIQKVIPDKNKNTDDNINHQ